MATKTNTTSKTKEAEVTPPIDDNVVLDSAPITAELEKHIPDHSIPRFEKELRRRINKGQKVRATLACPTPFSDDDCAVTAIPIFVDNLGDRNIKIITEDGTEIWLNTAFVVSVEFVDLAERNA